MAMTDLDFRMASTAGAQSMERRRSIDLNKHAFDLNEVPLNLGGEAQGFAMGRFDSSAMKLWPPRTGGWLELFHNMFGHDNSSMNLSSIARIPEQSFAGRHGQAPKRSSLHFLPEQYHNKRTRFVVAPQPQQHHPPMFEKPLLSNDFCPQPPKPPQQTFFLNPFLNPPQCFHSNPLSQAPRNSSSGLGSHQIVNQTLSHPTQQANSRFQRTLHCIPQPVEISRSFAESCPLIPKQEEQTSSTDFQLTAHCFPEQNERSLKAFHGISEPNHRSSFPEALPRCSLQEKHHSLCEQTFQMHDQEKSGSICRNNIGPPRYGGLPSFLSDTVETCQGSAIQIIPSPGWLPVGWITEIKTRKAGITAGTKDKYYKDPISGHRFRSKNEVMSYLQTGRVSRYKPKAKLLEGTAPCPIMMMSQFVPRQEQRPDIHKSIQFNPSTSFGVTLRESSTSLGHSTRSLEAFKSGVSKVVECMSDIMPNIFERQTKCSNNLILEKISVKQENELLPASIVLSHNVSRPLDIRTPLEGVCNLVQVKLETGEDPSIHESTTIPRLQKPVDEVQQTGSQIPSVPTPELPSDHYCFRQEGQDIPKNFNTVLWAEEAQVLHAKIEAKTMIVGAKDTQFPDEMIAVGNSMQVTGVSSSFGRHEELDQAKWTLNKKLCARKVTKLTPREGKELLVSLGRKLCCQFLGSVKKTVLYECNKQDTMQ